jgi:hypothetical protein
METDDENRNKLLENIPLVGYIIQTLNENKTEISVSFLCQTIII